MCPTWCIVFVCFFFVCVCECVCVLLTPALNASNTQGFECQGWTLSVSRKIPQKTQQFYSSVVIASVHLLAVSHRSELVTSPRSTSIDYDYPTTKSGGLVTHVGTAVFQSFLNVLFKPLLRSSSSATIVGGLLRFQNKTSFSFYSVTIWVWVTFYFEILTDSFWMRTVNGYVWSTFFIVSQCGPATNDLRTNTGPRTCDWGPLL